MEHVQFFYLLVTLLFGVVSLAITAIIYAKTQEQLLGYYLFFYSVFTIVIISEMFLLYKVANLLTLPPRIWVLKHIVVSAAKALLVFTAPLFVHYLVSVPQAKIKNIIFGGIAIMTYSLHFMSEFTIQNETIGIFSSYIERAILMVVVVYALLVGIYYSKKLGDPVRKQLARKFCILTGIFIPGILNDVFLHKIFPLRLSPLLYCSFSIIFTHYLIKTYFNDSSVPVNTMPDDAFFERYYISSREKEIIPLIVQGYSNQKIGEALFISPNTVKTHLRNIYAKLGVKNRYELISFVKDSCLNKTG